MQNYVTEVAVYFLFTPAETLPPLRNASHTERAGVPWRTVNLLPLVSALTGVGCARSGVHSSARRKTLP